jgi:hypothetical protein
MPVIPKEVDDMTVIATNVSLLRRSPSYAARALATMKAPTRDAIADFGSTQIFVMEGSPVKNKRQTTLSCFL